MADLSLNPNDLAVLEVNNGAVNTGSAITINELTKTTQSSPVESISTGLYTSGSATSTGYLTFNKPTNGSANSLLFTGETTTNGGNINTVTSRAVGQVSLAGIYSSPTTYTGSSNNQTRSAASLDNTNFQIGDQGGIYTNGGTSSYVSGSPNPRKIEIFGSTEYVGFSSSSTPAVETLSGTTLTALPGVPDISTADDFYLAKSGNSGNTYDTLYVCTSTALEKFALISGTWTAKSSVTISGGLFSIAAEATTGGFNIYATTGSGGATGNSVIKLFDSSAFNANINVNVANDVTLYTAPGTDVIKGIDFTPEPSAGCMFIGAGALNLFRKRRKRTQ